MFIGKYEHIIDDNNRLAIPSAIRKCIDEKKVGKGFFITPGLDRCLTIYPPLHFENLVKRLEELSFTNKKARTFLRLFFSRSSGNISCDKQGRIIVPQMLKDYAGLKKKVFIVGTMDKIEVWDSQLWEEFEKDNEQNFEGNAEDLFRMGYRPEQ